MNPWHQIADDIARHLADGSSLLRFLADLPDGYPSRSAGSGIPGGGTGIGDRTGEHATTRIEQMRAIEGAASVICARAHTAWIAVGGRPIQRASAHSVFGWLASARVAAASVAKALSTAPNEICAEEMHRSAVLLRAALTTIDRSLPVDPPPALTEAERRQARCPGWGPWAATCGRNAVRWVRSDGTETDGLCARCHEHAAGHWRCADCGQPLGPGPWPQQPVIMSMHAACYRRAYREAG